MKRYGTILRELRQRKGYEQKEVSKMLCEMGVPTTNSQISRWERDMNNPNMEQFIAICYIYSVKDLFAVFGIENLSAIEGDLNAEGMKKLNEYKELLIASGKYSPTASRADNVIPFRKKRTLPQYDLGVSAGTGVFLDSDLYEMVDVPDDVPLEATFATHVSGNSMEPTFCDGQTLWVKIQPTLENGEIGIFIVDGNAYVKEYSNTEKGVFLISHNKEYAPIRIDKNNEARICGKVVYPL